MPGNNVKSKSKSSGNTRQVTSIEPSTDRQTLVWSFDKVDRNDQFRFSCDRQDMQHDQLLNHIIQFSGRTWADIKQDTHDEKNKSKHHELDFDSLSKSAQARVLAMHIEDDIFSLALTNKLRIIGVRDGRVFRAIWFDPEHEFCPVKR